LRASSWPMAPKPTIASSNMLFLRTDGIRVVLRGQAAS